MSNTWIEHDGKGYPVPDGTEVTVRFRNGETGDFRIEGKYRNVPNGILVGSRCIWFWALHRGHPGINHNYDAVAYRIHDNGEQAKRQARIEAIRKWSQPNEYDVKPVKTPEREKIKQ
jgi:hypothetical protein